MTLKKRLKTSPESSPPHLPHVENGPYLFDFLATIEWFKANGIPAHRYEHLFIKDNP
jgi:hypothetical protein